jgi:hypothetical protein
MEQLLSVVVPSIIHKGYDSSTEALSVIFDRSDDMVGQRSLRRSLGWKVVAAVSQEEFSVFPLQTACIMRGSRKVVTVFKHRVTG